MVAYAVVPDIQTNSNLTQTLKMKDLYNVSCSADGIPHPRLVWRRNGSVLIVNDVPDEKHRWEVTQNTVMGGFRTQVPTPLSSVSQLLIRSVINSDDNTEFSCTAINSYRQYTTVTYKLIIQSG